MGSLWLSRGGGGGKRGTQRGQRQRQGDGGTAAWLPWTAPEAISTPWARVFLSLPLYPLCCIQPLAPPPPLPLSRLPPAMCPPVWATDPASVRRAVSLGEDGGQAVGSRAVGSRCASAPDLPSQAGNSPAGTCSVSLPPPGPGLPSLACSALRLLRRREGSVHHLPAPSQEIATIHHDQRSPSNPTGRAINFRDTVASGFGERNGGCVQGTLRPRDRFPPAQTPQPPPHPLPTKVVQPGAGSPGSCRHCHVSSPWFSHFEMICGLKRTTSTAFLLTFQKLLGCLLRMAGMSAGKANVPLFFSLGKHN